ncbi:MAG TPA: ABC transporter permease [Gemmatimonadaceae bacterium]|jgi:predicted permease|nr:ABC transporter permease [Gemmatimonadaceae bacterium]
MDALWLDLRHAARSLRKSPAVIGVAILVMALGIGAATAVFSIVNSVLIRPLPYSDPQRLAAISTLSLRDGTNREVPVVALTDLEAWRRETRSFESMGAFAYTQLVMQVGHSALYPVTALVDPELLPTLGNVLAMGTPFPARGADASDNTVVITHRLWVDAFNGDRDVLGRVVSIDGSPYTVRGVLAENFQFPRADASYSTHPVDLLVPAAAYPGFPASSQQWFGIVRLKAGVSIAQAQQELGAVSSRLAASSGNAKRASLRLTPLAEATSRSSRTALLLMLGMAIVLLVVAASNVMNLLFSRGTTRLHEMAIRKAMGSTTYRIVRQLMCESGIVVVCGAVAGVALAAIGANALVAISPVHLPVTGRIGIDRVVLEFTAAVAIVTAIVTGAFPAIHVAIRSNEALRNPSARVTSSRALGRLQRGLCIVQMTLGVALLGGAGVLTRSMSHLNASDPGFRTDSLLGFEVSVPNNHSMDERKQFYQRALDEIRAIPGVEAAGFTTFLPPEPRSGVFMGVTIEGAPLEPDAPPRIANTLVTSPGYFETIGMTMAAGRGFTSADDAKSPPVIIINETAATKFFGAHDPIGRRIATGFDGSVPVRAVIGVVHDTRDRGLGKDPVPTVYIPFQQFALMYGAIAVRTRVPPTSLVNPIRERLARLDAGIPLTNFQTIRSRISQSLGEPRFYTVLSAACAGMAVLFVALGVYGIISFSVAGRTTEFGVRMAVGARRMNIVRLVLFQSLRMALIAIPLGSVLSVILARSLRSMLFEVQPADPATLVGASCFVVAVMLVASFLPARRASLVSPTAALRYD